MPVSPKPSTLSALRTVTQVAAVAVTAVGVVVLVGWLVENDYAKSVIPGWATMKANTAFALAVSGAALWTLRTPTTAHAHLVAGRLLAALVVAIGALTLVGYLAPVQIGIDELLFRDAATPGTLHPGRMAPATAVNFILAGAALFTLQAHTRLSQWLSVTVLGVATLAIVGYVFGVSSLYQIAAYTSMAVHTAVSFAMLAIGMVVSRPTRGFMGVVVSDSAGGIAARRLLLLMPLVIFLIGVLQIAGETIGWYDGRFGVALHVWLSMLATTVLIGMTARLLYGLDLKRKLAEDEIVSLNADLERRVDLRTRELQESLASVKQLQGLLPICAWCKKIRDDHDYWHSVESYVAERSNASFTHGMCPDCSENFLKQSRPSRNAE